MEKKLRIRLSRSVRRSPLFSLLEECFEVVFVPDDDPSGPGHEAEILSGRDGGSRPLPSADLHTYVSLGEGGPPRPPGGVPIRVEFSGSVYAPWPFRSRTVENGFSATYVPVPPRAGYERIASVNGAGIWAAGTQGRFLHYEVGTGWPAMPEGEPLFRVFKGHNFIALLPLVEWLRNITGVSAYRPPRRTACVMIDDPNLHATRYGFIKFREVAEHARLNGYHMAFAAIPLDLFYANKEAVGIFRDAPDRLSLLIHGNNHLANELERDYDPGERVSLISQALARVREFEKGTGLSISRVMAAPHGVCSEPMLGTMARCGIEAASISFGSLFKANRGRPWTLSMGLGPARVVAGLPVFNRIHLSTGYLNEIFLAAYLNQPIIPNGHHGDLRDHLETLGSQVRVINSLTDISWGSMQDISSQNYLAKTDGEELRVKMLSRRIKLEVPPGVRRVRLEESELTGLDELAGTSCALNGRPSSSLLPGRVISATPGDHIVIHCPPLDLLDVSQGHWPPTPLKAVLRRIATESMDRLRPYAGRFLLS